MEYLAFIFKSALEDFRRNKVRTLLTILGIVIGVGAVVLLMSFVLGMKVFIRSQFEGLGTNMITVLPGRAMTRGGGFRPGGGTLGGVSFDEKDVHTIKKVKSIVYAVPYFVKTVEIHYAGKSEVTDVRGTTPDAFHESHLELDTGEFFNLNHNEKKSKVVVLGSDITKKLFVETKLATGKRVKIEGLVFTVIGTLKPKGDVSHFYDSAILIPYKTAFTLSADKQKFWDIHIQVDNPENIGVVKKKITDALLARYDENDFSVVEQTEILNTVGSIINVLGIGLVGVAAISLLVGGIGIMNIMYVTVTERIKEIGIRRAIGATKKDILYQFLSEAVILSLLGGLLGLLISFLIVLLIQRVFPAYINWQSVAIALGVSSLIGIIFGVFPAKKAADLTPVEAIRYE